MTTKTSIAFLIASLITLGASIGYGAPATAKAPAKDDLIHVATCVDGKEYYAKTNEHRGACSSHKGVAKWTDGSAVKGKGGKATSYR